MAKASCVPTSLAYLGTLCDYAARCYTLSTDKMGHSLSQDPTIRCASPVWLERHVSSIDGKSILSHERHISHRTRILGVSDAISNAMLIEALGSSQLLLFQASGDRPCAWLM
ncbi:hypothetical protein T440DRAFT_246322 [Plenodomus tracheiphilus IPT5]|uniref:Uncharacterized protein n=1 Tax=Plenodomus tracheiphilus IPT5 TaxID=1408161 RepID=A0A6A7AVF0_9PLEO|nr:hypothetical protein T440DRAFT_246322 [Plenodomus tracheiphilus IPT5]